MGEPGQMEQGPAGPGITLAEVSADTLASKLDAKELVGQSGPYKFTLILHKT